MAKIQPSRCAAVARGARFLSAVFSLLTLACALFAPAGRAGVTRGDAPDVYAIKDAQVVTSAGKVLAKGTVVFRNGLITDVGENVKIPADARVIEAAGMTVYPGLIDAMSSLGFQPQVQTPAPGRGPGRQAAVAAAVAAGAQPNPEAAHGDPSLSAADEIKPNAPGIEDARNAGITTALSSPRQGIFPGQSAVINLAGDETSKMVVRTPVALTVQFSTTGGFFTQYPNSLMGTVAYIRQRFYDAAHYRDEIERYDRVKRGVERPAHDKTLAALLPALKGVMPVMFLANTEGDIRRALNVAGEFHLKPIIAGALYGYRVLDMLKAAGVPVILSVDFPKRPIDLPEDEDETLRALRARAEAPKGAAKLAQAGVKFAFTSGGLQPGDFIANVRRAVENGLSKDDALRALTANAAEILGAGDQLGSIEVGKIANLIVESGDLFSKDAKLRHVFIDGSEIELKKPEVPAGRPGGFRSGGPGGPGAGAALIDPSGEWTMTTKTPQGDVIVKLTLRRDGGQVQGTLVAPMGSYEIHNASMSGNQLRFVANLQFGGDTAEAVFSAAIEGDSMQGSVTISSMGSFDFSGTRAPR